MAIREIKNENIVQKAAEETKKHSKNFTKFHVAVAQTDTNGKTTGGRGVTVNYNTLRQLRDINPLVNVCVEVLKHIVVKIPWKIHPKDDKVIDGYEEEIEYATKLFSFPNSQDTYRTFWLKNIEDILTIDRGCIETVRNANGDIVQLWNVDGATIKPNYDQYGILQDPAYVQRFDGELENAAEFNEEDIDILMNSPLGQTGMVGYGKSPVERVILTVITGINAENFNANNFNKNTLPPFAVNLVKGTKQQVEDLKNQWENQQGGNLWKGIFTGAEDIQIQKLRDSNQEMQYYELTLWLARIIIAAFELSPQDVGITMDVNRATGEVQQQITKSQAINNMLSLISEWHNKKLREMSINNPNFLELQFEFDELDKIDEKTQAEIDQINVTIGKVLANELRARDGMPPIETVIEDQQEIQEDTQQETEEDKTIEEEEQKTEEIQKSVQGKDKYALWYGGKFNGEWIVYE